MPIPLLASTNLSGYNCLENATEYVLAQDRLDVCLDLRQVAFVRPVGVAKIFLIASSLIKSGYDVTVQLPQNAGALSYLRRCGILLALHDFGLDVGENIEPYNVGNAPGLIEFTPIRTDLGGHDNADLIDVTRFRQYLAHHNIHSQSAALSWMEICSNAAEFSGAAPGSAFVIAQAYATELEIAVVDAGLGIPTTLHQYGFPSDAEAIFQAVISEEVTGRVDAGGNPMYGGLGLPYVRDAADRLYVRSGSGVISNASGLRDAEGLLLTASEGCNLAGTLVAATFCY